MADLHQLPVHEDARREVREVLQEALDRVDDEDLQAVVILAYGKGHVHLRNTRLRSRNELLGALEEAKFHLLTVGR